MAENNENQQNESGKVEKKFIAALRKLTAILKGESLYKPLKLDGEDVSILVEELAKEEKEALAKKFKENAILLIQEKRKFDNFIKEQEKEMKKKVEEKQKEFTAKAEQLFKDIERIETIEKEYFKTLGSAEEGKSSIESEEETK